MKRIVHDKANCIACGSCIVLCKKYWKWDDNSKDAVPKADLIKEEIEKEDEQDNMEAAEACPVNVIHIFDEEKKII